MPVSFKKGVVVNVDHQRRIGFVEEFETRLQYLFLFCNHGSVYTSYRSEIFWGSSTEMTYPQKNDVLYFIPDFGMPGTRVRLWVYQVEYVVCEAEVLRNRFQEERSFLAWQKKQDEKRQGKPQGNWQRTPPRKQWSAPKTPPPPPPPPRPKTTKKTWREILGFGIAERVTANMVSDRFRKLALTYHPDRGGSHDQMVELTWARTEAMKFVV